MHRSTAALAQLVILLVAAAASAQTTDHLNCYQMKDALNLAADVDIDSQQLGVASGCRVSKAKVFCVASSITVNSADDKGTKQPITPLPLSGPDPGDRICYKVKCPIVATIPDQTVTDEFGTRTLTKFKESYLCAPAIMGTPAPTATPTATATPTPTTTATPAPRFIDNGDGTVSDTQTGLQWEQKTSSCPGIHCNNDAYYWSNSGTDPDGPVFTTLLATLNGGVTGVGNCVSDGVTQTGGFAGHCDWRLPTIAELQTIMSVTPCPGPCVDPIFGLPTYTGAQYMSSTTTSTDSTREWVCGADGSGLGGHGKSAAFFDLAVAVRGGR